MVAVVIVVVVVVVVQVVVVVVAVVVVVVAAAVVVAAGDTKLRTHSGSDPFWQRSRDSLSRSRSSLESA